MKISKEIILPRWEKIEDLEQASDILHKITEAMKDHQIENYDDSVANFRRVTTGRIQSKDGETYFDLDSGVIRGEIVFRPGSSGIDNIEDASPNDWDNAFRLANAVCGDSDFTLISGGKIITNSVAIGAFNSDVVARMFSSETAHINIEAWMKSGAITYIDGNKIYAGSITLTGLGTTIVDGGYLKTIKINADYIQAGVINGIQFRCGGGTDNDFLFEDSSIYMYDYGAGGGAGYKGVALKYSSTIFFSVSLNPTNDNDMMLSVDSNSYTKIHTDASDNYSYIRANHGSYYVVLNMIPDGNSRMFYLRGTGTLQFPTLVNAPTAHEGDLACEKSGSADNQECFNYYINSAWRETQDTTGW